MNSNDFGQRKHTHCLCDTAYNVSRMGPLQVSPRAMHCPAVDEYGNVLHSERHLAAFVTHGRTRCVTAERLAVSGFRRSLVRWIASIKSIFNTI